MFFSVQHSTAAINTAVLMHIALDFREEASLVTREEEEERVLLVTFLGTLYICNA